MEDSGQTRARASPRRRIKVTGELRPPDDVRERNVSVGTGLAATPSTRPDAVRSALQRRSKPAVDIMSTQAIFTKFDDRDAIMWGNEPICVGHNLHRSTLFSSATLARLIESYPREHYNVYSMGAQGNDSRYWRRGDHDGMSGEDVLTAIANGRLWLNLRNVNQVDRRYAQMLDDFMDELAERMPGFVARRKNAGILISSPMAQVYYHVDLPGQLLFQIAGRKKLYFYPAHAPFITHELLEQIAVTGLELGIPYEPWFDDYARVVEFQPGQMAHWPHFGPHRVVNHDCLNISMTVEFATDAIRRTQMVNYANGILRHGFGWTPRSRAISGPSFWTKAVVQKTLHAAPWIRKQKTRNEQIEFRLDPKELGGIVELPMAAE
jgi:hypothetical protein